MTKKEAPPPAKWLDVWVALTDAEERLHDAYEYALEIRLLAGTSEPMPGSAILHAITTLKVALDATRPLREDLKKP